MNYKILAASTRSDLEVLVEDAILCGWEPLGTPLWDAEAREFYVACRKREEQPAPEHLNLREKKRR